jgi:hypothetical protein
MRSKTMSSEWIDSSAELPHEGEPVEFLLEGRDVAMDGTYTHQSFRSHWSVYEVGRVRNWRLADADPPVAHG